MSNEINTANVEAEQSSMENTNMSVSDFANRRIGQLQSQQEPEPVEAQEEEVQTQHGESLARRKS